MPLGTNNVTVTTAAKFIPEIWSDEIVAAYKKNLVLANVINKMNFKGKKGVPVDALEKWIKARGIQGRDKKGRFIKRRSLAFAIQTNIKKFGIKASNWYDVAIDKVLEDNEIIELLEGAAIEDLINAIEGI